MQLNLKCTLYAAYYYGIKCLHRCILLLYATAQPLHHDCFETVALGNLAKGIVAHTALFAVMHHVQVDQLCYAS